MTSAFLFIGPTLAACQSRLALSEEPLASYQLKPPARRGDIAALVEANPTPGVIILVDGAIENSLAVSHSELLQAKQSGWQVWGLADIGAIRAWEMRHCGINGYGDVYQQLQQQADLRDDEILWSWHTTDFEQRSDGAYQIHNEPMIHLSKALYHLQQQGHLSAEHHQQVSEQLQQTWYKRRTLPLLIKLVQQQHPTIDQSVLTLLSADFSRFELKQQDFLRFVTQQPWQL